MWFLNRLTNLGWAEWEALVPLLVAVLAVVGTVLRGGWRLIRRRPRAADRPPLLLIVPPLASLAFTITNMPMPRYAGSAASLLGVTALMVAAEDVLLRRTGRWLLITASAALVAWPLHASGRFHLGLTDFQRPPAARVQPVRLASGLEVYVPLQNNLTCWDAFPCTPVLNPALRLRRDGDLGSGFVLGPSAGKPLSGDISIR
jgi:hypothetical protein